MTKRIHRYNKSHILFNNYFSSKFPQFKHNIKIKIYSIDVQAGLYKLNSLLPEHGFILSTLIAQPVQLNYQLHGKRQYKTVSINAKIYNKFIWLFLDKFLHELFTHMYEFSTPKMHKWNSFNKTLGMRIRQKFNIIPEYGDLVENIMYDTHKGIYLPLTINLQLNNFFSNFQNEVYLRMLRLPINLFKRRSRPAFDDKISFEGVHYLYAE